MKSFPFSFQGPGKNGNKSGAAAAASPTERAEKRAASVSPRLSPHKVFTSEQRLQHRLEHWSRPVA